MCERKFYTFVLHGKEKEIIPPENNDPHQIAQNPDNLPIVLFLVDPSYIFFWFLDVAIVQPSGVKIIIFSYTTKPRTRMYDRTKISKNITK